MTRKAVYEIGFIQACECHAAMHTTSDTPALNATIRTAQQAGLPVDEAPQGNNILDSVSAKA